MKKSNFFNKELVKVFNISDETIFKYSSSSKGNQAKYIIDNYFIKKDYLGYESISEVICSILASCIEDFNYVEYNFCSVVYKEVAYNDCCYSKNFLNNGERLISLYGLFDNINVNIDKYLKNYSTDICLMKIKELFNLNQETISNICKMLLFDSLILNEDRHFNNICFIINESGCIRLSPVFDNGGSLLSDVINYPLLTSDLINIRSVKSKPFSMRFNKQIKGVLRLGIRPLRIDINKFNSLISNIRVIDVCSKYLNRSLNVLKFRLKELEGTVWQDI